MRMKIIVYAALVLLITASFFASYQRAVRRGPRNSGVGADEKLLWDRAQSEKRSRLLADFRAHTHPILNGLADGRISAGLPVAPLFRQSPPNSLRQYQAGAWTEAQYDWPFEQGRALKLVAKRGRLVFVEYFDDANWVVFVPMDSDDDATFAAVLDAFAVAWPLFSSEPGRYALMAVAGSPAYINFHDSPLP